MENIRETIAGYLEAAEMQAQMAPEGVQVERVAVLKQAELTVEDFIELL